jgi:replication initiator protein RepSA
VDLPASLDPVLADLIGTVNSPDYDDWVRQVHGIGGCSNPIHLAGYTRVRDATTGEVAYEYSSREAAGGVVLVRCGNRRASVCSSCAAIYSGDIYHLVRSGLAGGKGVPDSVATHPRVFATLTAPGFGAVHTVRPGAGGRSARPCHPRRTASCEHGRATSCQVRHGDDDPLLGTPLCGQCYDYAGSVVWQASVGDLWSRFRTYLPRHLATLSGRTRAQVAAELRLSFVKIVEYQVRGLIHVHVVIRVDGIPTEDPDDPVESQDEQTRDEDQDSGTAAEVVAPPDWVDALMLAEAVESAARAVVLSVEAGRSGAWSLRWGSQVHVRDITDTGGESPGKVAAYVAKYASKATEVTGWDPSGRLDTPRAVHTAAMVRAAWRLAEVPELERLKLGRWAKALAYRGHVSSKSRRYSTTLGALRQQRAQFRAAAGQTRRPSGEGWILDSFWELVGHGYTPGQAVIAADIARDEEINRAAFREAGAARPRAGGRDNARRHDDVTERGARVASQQQAPTIGGDAHNGL